MDVFQGEDDGVSPVIGVVLMVAITVALAAVVAIVVTSSGDQLNEGGANAKVEFEPSPAGVILKVEHISNDAEIQVNGKTVDTVSKDSAGQEFLIPTKPGDKITLVSGNRESSVLVSKTIEDRSEVSDLIVSYGFDTGGSPDTLKDTSGNGNDATVYGDPQWTGDSLKLDGDDDFAITPDLKIDGKSSIDEITYAIKYKKQSGRDDIENLIEYGGNDWYIETRNKFTDPYQMQYRSGSGGGTVRTNDLSEGQTYTLVGATDGDEATIYIDGTEVDSASYGGSVELGEIVLGGDSDALKDRGTGAEDDKQDLTGELIEFRVYYTAFDEADVKTISEAL